ncbi:MAG: hypothetical protein IIC93_06675 [Chloroflexi bacterium]|nr:hypothetical protein [Chloroflexota bacterium]
MPSERVNRRIDSLLDDADTALERRDWQAALESAEAVLGFDAENAEMLLDGEPHGDREKATALQDEAIAIELGMQPLLERVLAQREILKA